MSLRNIVLSSVSVLVSTIALANAHPAQVRCSGSAPVITELEADIVSNNELQNVTIWTYYEGKVTDTTKIADVQSEQSLRATSDNRAVVDFNLSGVSIVRDTLELPNDLLDRATPGKVSKSFKASVTETDPDSPDQKSPYTCEVWGAYND